MRCITIQDKEVLKILIEKKEYYTDRKPKHENLIEPYEFAKKIYEFRHMPIFLVPEDGIATFVGATLENSVAITLDIPDELIRRQFYYEWTDLIYFIENPEEFEDVFDTDKYPSVEEYGKEILLNPIGDGYIETQLMVERLSVDWLIGIDYEPQVVFDKFEERRQKYVYTT